MRAKYLKDRFMIVLLDVTAGRRELFFIYLLGTISLTNLSDMMSQAASCLLQNAIKYCKKCVKWVQLAKELNILITV